MSIPPEMAGVAMESLAPYIEQYDPENATKVRVTLYKGQYLMSEMWHKSEEELAIEGCEASDADAEPVVFRAFGDVVETQHGDALLGARDEWSRAEAH